MSGGEADGRSQGTVQGWEKHEESEPGQDGQGVPEHGKGYGPADVESHRWHVWYWDYDEADATGMDIILPYTHLPYEELELL